MHLKSRNVTFRLQFLQRFLYGPAHALWRRMTGFELCQAGGLGLEGSVFLLKTDKLSFVGLSSFYLSVLKHGNYLGWGSRPPIHRSLSERCRKVTVITVRHLEETAGVNLDQAVALAQKLGLRSTSRSTN